MVSPAPRSLFKPTSLHPATGSVPSFPPLLVISSSSLRLKATLHFAAIPPQSPPPPLFQMALFARFEKPRRPRSWGRSQRRRRLLKRNVLLSLGETGFDAGEGEKFSETYETGSNLMAIIAARGAIFFFIVRAQKQIAKKFGAEATLARHFFFFLFFLNTVLKIKQLLKLNAEVENLVGTRRPSLLLRATVDLFAAFALAGNFCHLPPVRGARREVLPVWVAASSRSFSCRVSPPPLPPPPNRARRQTTRLELVWVLRATN